MLWKSRLPDDLAALIEAARAREFAARLALPEEDDWDDDFDAGPQVIYARGEGPDDEDEDDCEQ
jgi:hypothetical protein